MEGYCEDYKRYLDAARTEREAVSEAIRLAEAKGFVPLTADTAFAPGSKVYWSNRGKALLLAVVGAEPLSAGAVVAAAHVDSPRLDLKQLPVYEDSELCYFKTHYYGGIKKYQWLTIPLALHGVVVAGTAPWWRFASGRTRRIPSSSSRTSCPTWGRTR